MNKLAQLLRSTLCVLVFVGSSQALAGQNILYYLSQPGDFIGQGAEVTFTAADGTFTVGPMQAGLGANFNTPGFTHFWTLLISAADNVPLQVGAYENAVGSETPGRPRLSFFGDGRGCNESGRFDVFEIVRDASGTVTQLAVNFEQRCENFSATLFGQYRFNSDIPLVKPLVIALENPLNARGCVEATSPNGASISVNVNDAISNLGGRPLRINWSATTGAGGTAPSFSFNGPLTTDPANPIVVTVSLTDVAINFTRTATKSICVSDTTPPAIVINSPLPGQSVIGDSLVLDVTIKDAVDKNITQYEVLVGSDYLTPVDPLTGRTRQNVLAKPKANGPVAVTITVRATDVSGNTGQKSVTVNQTP